MRYIKNSAVLYLLIFYGNIFSQAATDPVFENLKSFYNQQAGCRLNKLLFTKYAKNDSLPFNYVYVSLANSIKNALGKRSFIFTGPDAERATAVRDSFSTKGYSAFHYQTFGNSEALITKNLLNYSSESKAFLVFHELTHNYIIEKNKKMDYLLNEAACDVTAVMFSRLLLKEQGGLDSVKLELEIRSLETVYAIINETIKKISGDSLSCKQYCSDAGKKIAAAIKNNDVFFKDRFMYPVNMAYLLKNSNYCAYYFEVKEIYLASKNFKQFIKALTRYPKTRT